MTAKIISVALLLNERRGTGTVRDSLSARKLTGNVTAGLIRGF